MYREMDTINNKTLQLMEEELLRAMKDTILPDIAHLVQQEAFDATVTANALSTYLRSEGPSDASSFSSSDLGAGSTARDCINTAEAKNVMSVTLAPSLQQQINMPSLPSSHWAMILLHRAMHLLGIYDAVNGVILWNMADLVMLCLLTALASLLVGTTSLVCVVCTRRK
jgi:hypothetical protein